MLPHRIHPGTWLVSVSEIVRKLEDGTDAKSQCMDLVLQQDAPLAEKIDDDIWEKIYKGASEMMNHSFRP